MIDQNISIHIYINIKKNTISNIILIIFKKKKNSKSSFCLKKRATIEHELFPTRFDCHHLTVVN